MKILLWLLRIALFVALFGLAVKNSGMVELRFFFDQSAQLPLSLALLAAFVAGVVMGLTAILATVARQRRQLGALRKRLKTDEK
ncbi:MAG: lipopolysaccharide assembly protein LapA domain-containing protein [Rhodocyclaceae bacterium]|jgi:uncharacterized integral membrane protein|nr:lipopolysaccharide assembly protein LapA domain-containing protein [Rhodocyclaceae bacterium]